MSDVRAWLGAHEGGVPPALAAHLRDAVRIADGPVADLLAAGERLLRRAIAATPMTRAQALDVLGADALVTCAFEAAADDPSRLVQRADAAMTRIAALAEEPA